MQVEIWSDVMCPWCAVGKARFEQALAAFPHADEVEVRWRSFELDPDAPEEKDGEYVSLLASKYGTSPDEAQGMVDTMTATAAAEGLDFRFDRVRPGNTFDAHRLLHLAADRGLQHELKDRFLTAYLTEGEAVGRPDVLQRLASEVGLDEVEVKEVLAGDAYADAVRADERQAMTYGIRGVPFFVLDGRLGVSGAQPAEVLLGALTQAHGQAHPLAMHDHAAGDDHGDACADGSCAV
ncbi:MAG: DsbA family oxidoreductase [Actinobacteria bacterium]|nr:DsbA family oxidoreductase [Actinomycetota bacterium]